MKRLYSKLQVASCKLQVAGCKLQVAGCKYGLVAAVLLIMNMNAIAQPTGVNVYPVSTDSIGITWNDNSSTETGYVIRVVQNEAADTLLFGKAANTVSDTLTPWCPPNSRFDVSVGVITASDTTYSAWDSTWSFAELPPAPRVDLLSDTSLRFYINGRLFDERFSDKDFTQAPVWTVQSGSFEVKDYQLRATTASASVMSTAFTDLAGSKINNGVWEFRFKFSDSTAAAGQSVSLFAMANKASITDSSFYEVTVSGDDTLRFKRGSVTGSATVVQSVGSLFYPQTFFKWHTVKLERKVTVTPLDTTVNFEVSWDDTLAAMFSEKAYLSTRYFGLKTNGASNIRVDNIQLWQATPSGNHVRTEYAVQDALSGFYFQSDSTLQTFVEDWVVDKSAGYVITGLTPNTAYNLRTKARNEWADLVVVLDLLVNNVLIVN